MMPTAKFYYIRSAERKPVVTVCLACWNGQIARGVALCAPSDNPSKAIGRQVAYGRAVKALIRQGSSLSCRLARRRKLVEHWSLDPAISLGAYAFKSRYRPQPCNDLERTLMKTLLVDYPPLSTRPDSDAVVGYR